MSDMKRIPTITGDPTTGGLPITGRIVGDAMRLALGAVGREVPIDVWRAFVVAIDPEHAPDALQARIAELEAEADEMRVAWKEDNDTHYHDRNGFAELLAVDALAELSGMDPDESSVGAMAEHAQAKLDSARLACDDATGRLRELADGEIRVGETLSARKLAQKIRDRQARELASASAREASAVAHCHELQAKLDVARTERQTMAEELAERKRDHETFVDHARATLENAKGELGSAARELVRTQDEAAALRDRLRRVSAYAADALTGGAE